MEQIEASRSSPSEKDESVKQESWCLTRVGKDSDWLRLYDNTEVTIGRGLNVTHQIVSPSCPLMLSRLHCLFKQTEDGQWTVTDKKSLNGVWVNGDRITADKAHQLSLGDSIKLGVPIVGTDVEYEYTLVRQPLKDIRIFLGKGSSEEACIAPRTKKTKRKSDELEPSTSSKSKLCCRSATDKSSAHPCPSDEHPDRPHPRLRDRIQGTSNPMTDLQRYSQNMLVLRERLDDTQRRVAALEGDQRQDDPHREEQVRELRTQLEVLSGQMHRMEMLERSISETGKRLEVQKTQQQEEGLKKQLADALQEQKKVMEELALSRQDFKEVLLAKDKELEVTKEEKEKARAQKEEVVTQMTEVLENELQCIVCSELFIQSVTLNCAHSFCLHCIREWRKRKDECPICRRPILSQARSLVLDNCIDRMVENLSSEMRDRRLALITERKAQPGVEVLVIHDDDSSSSSSTTSSSSHLTISSSSSNLSNDSSSSLLSLRDSNHWGSEPSYLSSSDSEDENFAD